MTVSKGKKTIKQLARSLNVDLPQMHKLAQRVLRLPKGRAHDPNYSLTPHQCKLLEDASGPRATAVVAETGPSEKPMGGEAPEEQNPPLELRLDPPSDSSEFEFGELNHRLWLHPDVPQGVQNLQDIRKRLGLVLHHLGAHGRTSVVKGCQGQANRGWLRSPLGGNGGSQYYLWWAPQGHPPVKDLELPTLGILVRAVRHHNDHAPLTAGVRDDYLEFRQAEIDDESLVGRPWTSEQLNFIESEAPVRLILGRPGSGKTTVLWKAIEARGDQAVLYLTWSSELTRQADEHFAAFAPVDVRVETKDFTSFLGELRREDVHRQTLAESQIAFGDAIGRLEKSMLGPWSGKEKALHAEVRAFLLGRALPNEDDSLPPGDVVRLSDKAYSDQRGGRIGVGRGASRALLKVFAVIEKEVPLAAVFPELSAAAQAIERLRADEIPAEFLAFDRVVVDEVQDLTLLEFAVVVEFCRAVARSRGQAPWLLVAGDEGQTVRPSGFAWGPLKDLLTLRVARPRRFDLKENLRCPERIAGVVERASACYRDLEKERRPTKQGHESGGQHVNAQLIHVATDSIATAVELLEKLEDVENLAVVSPCDEVPSWVPETLQDMVLTPAQAKGLEYQSVCVLDPGRLLVGLQEDRTDAGAPELDQHLRRTSIDQLRVSLSRATEALVFLDVGMKESEQLASSNLLKDPAPFDPEDLVEHFTDADVSVVERVMARTLDARAFLEERPRRAWRRAHQAVRLLGEPDLPNGVSEQSVREEAWRTLLATAMRLVVDGPPDRVHSADLLNASSEALEFLGFEGHERALKLLGNWALSREGSVVEMLEALRALDRNDDWVRGALARVAQALRNEIKQGSQTRTSAKFFEGDVEGWLVLTGYAGDATEEANSLRCQAVDTLLDAGDLRSAELVLQVIKPEDLQRTARLRESQDSFEEAAEVFESLGMSTDALRNWRKAGRWDEALRLAEGSERDDLSWLGELEELGKRRPSDHQERLTRAEQQRLDELLDAVRKGATHPSGRVKQ